ncbi:MAG: periplasmic heavy metal sensor [Thermoguttaceae bacterium]|nr:periplasmic heavy metal sensor [Thermoguttaceae bacterium]
MWKTLKPYVLVASVALNAAFVAIWLAHAASTGATASEPPDKGGVWCPLHRQLDVTAEQWAVIEPRLIAFQKSVGQLRRQIDDMRAEVIEMLADETTDLDAIRARQDDINAVRQTIQAKMVDHLLAEKDTLAPDQRERFFKLLRDRTACGTQGPPMSGGACRKAER